MSAKTDTHRHIAMTRFGLGASARDAALSGADPRAWLRRQLGKVAMPVRLEALPGSAAELRRTYAYRALEPGEARDAARDANRKHLLRVMTEHFRNAVETQTPLVERLVMFWANHFTVSGTRGVLRLAVPAYVTEAIRPHVLGRFENMLQAVVAHPAMLIYLDNTSSVGPNSRNGKRRARDLNENLAREVMELHTLGARGGYSQADVTTFAKILTGWRVDTRGRRDMMQMGSVDAAMSEAPASLGTFRFDANRHEPGPQTLLGQRFEPEGVGQGRAALGLLASHPSTARHIATKLATHFVADTPPGGLIDALAAAFMRSGGDLGQVTRVLIDHEASWSAPGAKIKQPYEYMVAAIRNDDRPQGPRLPNRLFLQALISMGQDPVRTPSPAGWPDSQSDWVSPAGLMRRLEWAQAVAERLRVTLSPTALYDLVAGPLADEPSRRLIAGAPSATQGLALVLSSPAFQRR